jgi:hypothetical protein
MNRQSITCQIYVYVVHLSLSPSFPDAKAQDTLNGKNAMSELLCSVPTLGLGQIFRNKVLNNRQLPEKVE